MATEAYTKTHLTGRRTVHYEWYRLEVVSGPDAGFSEPYAGTTVKLGTDPDNHVVLTDKTVSGSHCQITFSERGYRVRDTRPSTNGVTINGMRVYDVQLTSAVKLVLGSTTVAITPLTETDEREQATPDNDRFGLLLGKSVKMRELYALLEKVAPSDLSVHIQGETGVGKDVVARTIHEESTRAEGRIAVLDCSAHQRNADMLADALFGHVRGAYAGAVKDREGVFEYAKGGTVFIDEIGELPLDLQPFLLSVLERKVVMRIGSNREVPVDMRVISATHKDLAAMVVRGAFREDLYHRLVEATVRVPPLRERREDILMLVEHFLSVEAPTKSMSDIPEEVQEMLQLHPWPGNVRQLRKAVRRMSVSVDLWRDDDALPAAPAPAMHAPELEPLQQARAKWEEVYKASERAYFDNLMLHTKGRASKAAVIAQTVPENIRKHFRNRNSEQPGGGQ